MSYTLGNFCKMRSHSGRCIHRLTPTRADKDLCNENILES